MTTDQTNSTAEITSDQLSSTLKEYLLPSTETDSPKSWPEEFNQVLKELSASSDLRYSWDVIKDIIYHKILLNITVPPSDIPNLTDSEDVDTYKDLLFNLLDYFDESPPFTLQRLAELAIDPFIHYRSIPKYFRALEKVLTITTDGIPVNTLKTIEPEPSQIFTNSLPPNPNSPPLIPYLEIEAKLPSDLNLNIPFGSVMGPKEEEGKDDSKENKGKLEMDTD
ncbi:hypothetical protein HK098_001453 [Nowakowskiella sp. JEL0407]|nr:hypothetical protein HK098_001453 [Nowakowskiella sp. JEL0407]